MLGLWVHVTCAWFRPEVVFLHYKRIYLRLRGNISVTLIYRCRYGRPQLSVTIDGADKSYNCCLIQLCEYNVQVIAGPIFSTTKSLIQLLLLVTVTIRLLQHCQSALWHKQVLILMPYHIQILLLGSIFWSVWHDKFF